MSLPDDPDDNGIMHINFRGRRKGKKEEKEIMEKVGTETQLELNCW